MGKLKGILGLLIVAGSFYFAWNMVPPYFHNYQLQDDLDDIARHNTYTTKGEDDIRELVINKASSYNVDVKPEQVLVTRSSDGVGISVHYSVHLDMILHPMDLDFTANSMNKRI
jgi:hypothetical protein